LFVNQNAVANIEEDNSEEKELEDGV